MADLRKYCLILYGLYGLSAVLQFFNKTILIGLAALVIAYFMATARKKAAEDTPFASHLRWMLRTFWIGTGVIFPIAIIIATAIVLAFTDLIPVMVAASFDNPEAQMNAMQDYMQANMTKISLLTEPFMLLSAFWWLRRCWVGGMLAKNGKPVENVTSWL
ncbi:MAG: hypothetical protein K8R48_00630 [Alphaproteobacteria bacterium]|nr:hypothetical protein [Alphaproteobacteria bacterium]